MAHTNGLATNQLRAGRNAEIYERALLGESQSSLAREFKLNPSRIYKLVQDEEKRRRLQGRLWGARLLVAWARAAYIENLEPIE